MLMVLVVDDDRAVADSVCALLTAHGYATVTPPARFTAEQIGDLACDVLLTDMVMPGVDGWEVIRSVRARRPELPIVAFTGHDLSAYPAVSDMARDATGADALLRKPLRPGELIGAIERCVEARRHVVGA